MPIPYDAKHIAKYILIKASEDESYKNITNLKLQKILFYTQAWYLANYGEAVFSDEIHAWEYGPVVPSVYHEYKKFKRDPIQLDFNDLDISNIDTDTKLYLDNIWEAYKHYSGLQLVDFTHKEESYIKARKIEAYKPMYLITKESMEESFSKRLKNVK